MPSRARRLRNAAHCDALTLLEHQGLALTEAEVKSLKVTVELGHITIDWQLSGAAAPDPTDLATQILQDVELRLKSGGSKDRVAKHARRVPRKYRDQLYRSLGELTPITQVHGPYPGAYVALKERLQDILQVTPGDKLNTMLTPEGKFCVVARLGIDGTSRWNQPLEVYFKKKQNSQVFTLSVAKSQQASNCHPVGYYLGPEKRAVVRQFLAHTGWEKELQDTPFSIPLKRGSILVDVTIIADHVCRVALRECDSPSCRKPHYRTCPFCDAQPLTARDPGAAVLPVRDSLRKLECFPSVIPLYQPPDALHGIGRTTKTLRQATTSWCSGKRVCTHIYYNNKTGPWKGKKG